MPSLPHLPTSAPAIDPCDAPHVPWCAGPLPEDALTKKTKFKANTCVLLPEYHTTATEGETPTEIAHTYGRNAGALVRLNQWRSASLDCADDLTAASKLPAGTLIILPHTEVPDRHGFAQLACAQQTGLKQPLGPTSGAQAPSAEALAAAYGACVLQVGTRLWVNTFDETLDGRDEDGGNKKVTKWRTARVRTPPTATSQHFEVFEVVLAHRTSVLLATHVLLAMVAPLLLIPHTGPVCWQVGGDHGWTLDQRSRASLKEQRLSLEDEGVDWQRWVLWESPFQANPRGALGSGGLIPPFATFLETERFTESEMRRLARPRPATPPEGWLASLRTGSVLEVSGEGGSKAAAVLCSALPRLQLWL